MRKTRSTRKLRGGKADYYCLRTKSTDSTITHTKEINHEQYIQMMNNKINVHNYVVRDEYLKGDLDVSKLPTIASEKDDDTIIVATYPPIIINIHKSTSDYTYNDNKYNGGSRRRKRRKSIKRKSSSRQS